MKAVVPLLSILLIVACSSPASEEPIGPQGTLAGVVTLGPNCPVERPGVVCEPPPGALQERTIQVQTEFGELVQEITPENNGSYSITLAPGRYYIDLAPYGIDSSGDVPKFVTVEENKTTEFDIDIDTGIR